MADSWPVGNRECCSGPRIPVVTIRRRRRSRVLPHVQNAREIRIDFMETVAPLFKDPLTIRDGPARKVGTA